jgi:hypothetical protein
MVLAGRTKGYPLKCEVLVLGVRYSADDVDTSLKYEHNLLLRYDIILLGLYRR